jgi:hypothetical protein
MSKKRKKPMAKKSKAKNLRIKKSQFSSKQLVMFAAVFAAFGGFVIWHSLAAPVYNHRKTNAPLYLVSQTIANPQTPPAPLDCLNEDDQDDRFYSGSLNGSFSSTYKMCDVIIDGLNWSAGGEGIEADVSVVGTLSDLTITTPTGEVRHAVYMKSTTDKNVTTNYYAVCFCPPFSLTTHTGTDPVPGGTYTLTLSGNITKASYTTRADMAYPTRFQQAYCPTSQQNLTP